MNIKFLVQITLLILFSYLVGVSYSHLPPISKQNGKSANSFYEGCLRQKAPPVPYYKNLYSNTNLTSIPQAYLDKMKTIVDQVSEMIVQDFPPEFNGEYNEFVYWGTAGRAAMSLRLYKDTSNQIWLNRAKSYIDYALQKIKPYQYKGIEFAYHKGRTGIAALGAIIYQELGNTSESVELLKEVNWYFDQVKDGDYYDWESGIAGLVYAGKLLNKYFNREVVQKEKITYVLTLAYNLGMKYFNSTTGAMQFEYYQGHYWTGMGSHGSGSPIYALLQSEELMQNETIRTNVLNTIDYFLSIQTKEGQIPGDLVPDRTQWCHGIPGLLPPIGLAYKLFNNKKYYDAGLLGSKLTSEIGILSKGMQFCHGVGGNIYMILDFYNQTKDPQILSMAISMIMTSLDTPKLTDPTQWESYDCVADGMFVSSSIGMVLLYSDILKNVNNLENVQMLSYHLSI